MRSLFVHLRLHFQLLLAPVYLWGWLIAGGELSVKVLLGFVAFHGFLYSGATAFNSSYDRDVGPVGGLEHPPRVTAALLPFSLAVQAIGWVIAAFVNWTFCLAYGLFVVLSVAYSHPRIRWKARTFTSVLVVGLRSGSAGLFRCLGGHPRRDRFGCQSRGPPRRPRGRAADRCLLSAHPAVSNRRRCRARRSHPGRSVGPETLLRLRQTVHGGRRYDHARGARAALRIR